MKSLARKTSLSLSPWLTPAYRVVTPPRLWAASSMSAEVPAPVRPVLYGVQVRPALSLRKAPLPAMAAKACWGSLGSTTSEGTAPGGREASGANVAPPSVLRNSAPPRSA
ncbi:MAG: hypothetical protein U0797_16570 [Gemmataceae bacterium]